jgi:uncharacterized protein (DUF302 family)
MSYYFTKIVELTYEEAIQRVTEELKKEGFGVLTEIDVQETLKKKLDVNFRNYKILGACNPLFAHKALQAESKIGLMLPCNVIVQENPEGKIEVSAIKPSTAMQGLNNPQLVEVAATVESKLQQVIEHL